MSFYYIKKSIWQKDVHSMSPKFVKKNWETHARKRVAFTFYTIRRCWDSRHYFPNSHMQVADCTFTHYSATPSIVLINQKLSY